MEKIIRNKLYKEFIEPTKQRKNFIGIEIEVPIINLNKKPVDFDIVHKITDNFKKELPLEYAVELNQLIKKVL